MRAAKADANQPEIIAALRKIGYSVISLHRVGQGCPDLLAAKAGETLLIEVKDGRKAPSQQKLTPQQERFIENWNGAVDIVRSVEDVLKLDSIYGKR